MSIQEPRYMYLIGEGGGKTEELRRSKVAFFDDAVSCKTALSYEIKQLPQTTMYEWDRKEKYYKPIRGNREVRIKRDIRHMAKIRKADDETDE